MLGGANVTFCIEIIASFAVSAYDFANVIVNCLKHKIFSFVYNSHAIAITKQTTHIYTYRHTVHTMGSISMLCLAATFQAVSHIKPTPFMSYDETLFETKFQLCNSQSTKCSHNSDSKNMTLKPSI